MMSICDSAARRRSRLMYLFQAALEYLISIPVTGSFLAALTEELGISDSLTGILSSVISLGCLFQLMSLSVRKAKIKKLVIGFSIINQLCFVLLYVIPLTAAAKQVKIACFALLICAAYLTYYFIHPKKIDWLMSFIDERRRGVFTARKETVSLASGMVFSFGMGAAIDRFAESGKIKTAFLLSAAVLLLLLLLHTLTLLFTAEQQTPHSPPGNAVAGIGETLKNKKVLQAAAVFVLYHISYYASVPFYGTYQIHELGFSLKTVSLLAIFGNIARICTTGLWGRYADRKSFAAMTEKCLLFLAAAQICALFAVPANGIALFALYYFFFGIAMGGINSALINLIFDYTDPSKRSDTLAVTQAVSGAAGFLSALCAGPLVLWIQKNHNRYFGIPLYAQQLCTAVSLIFTVFAMLYVRNRLINKSTTR